MCIVERSARGLQVVCERGAGVSHRKATGRSAQVRRLRTLANRVARQRRAELHHRYLRYAVSSTVGIDLKPGFAKK